MSIRDIAQNNTYSTKTSLKNYATLNVFHYKHKVLARANKQEKDNLAEFRAWFSEISRDQNARIESQSM